VIQRFYKGVTRVVQGWYKGATLCSHQGTLLHHHHLCYKCYKGVTKVLQGCYKGVTRVLQKCYKGVTRVLQGCYKDVTRMLQEHDKALQGCEYPGGYVCQQVEAVDLVHFRAPHSTHRP
jgi:hypothetical protein